MIRTRKPLSLALVPVAALMLTSCGGQSAPTVVDSAVTPNTNSQASSPASSQAGSPTASTTAGTSAPASDSTSAALQAIATAEAAEGGRAYSIDDLDDDGTWEVDVLLSDKSVEYEISADGTTVVSRDDNDDADERASLANATVTITQAIQTAVAEGGAPLDDAEWDDESGSWAWEVSLQGRDTDIVIDPTSGAVVSS